MSLKRELGKVTVEGSFGLTYPRQAEIYGGVLALIKLPDLSGRGWWWSVTHVPTGLCAADRRRKTEALKLLRGFLRIAPAETWREVRVRDGKVLGLSREQLRKCRKLKNKPHGAVNS